MRNIRASLNLCFTSRYTHLFFVYVVITQESGEVSSTSFFHHSARENYRIVIKYF